MANITKKELASIVAQKTGFPQADAQTIIQATFDQLTEELGNGNRLEFRNFGIFEPAVRRARVGRNPNAPEKDVKIPERVAIKFKPGKIMNEQVAQLAPETIL